MMGCNSSMHKTRHQATCESTENSLLFGVKAIKLENMVQSAPWKTHCIPWPPTPIHSWRHKPQATQRSALINYTQYCSTSVKHLTLSTPFCMTLSGQMPENANDILKHGFICIQITNFMIHLHAIYIMHLIIFVQLCLFKRVRKVAKSDF